MALGATLIGVSGAVAVGQSPTGTPTTRRTDRLIPVVKLGDKVANGVTVNDAGRIFLCLQGPAQFPGVQIAEYKDGGFKPYPDVAWNTWHTGDDTTKKFVHVNSLRIGPEGDLWIVDTGGLGLGKPVLPGGPKVVRIDLKTNKVRQTYPLDTTVTKPKSFVDDIRFNKPNAYLTDAGQPALIVLNTETGKARRILDNHPSTVAQLPASGEGKVLKDADFKPVKLHADQLEVNNDGRWFYYQPQTGPLYRIETRWLDDASLTDSERARHIQRFVTTPSTGGTAMDAAGNLYVTDTDRLQILKITPSGKKSVLIEDKRLLWADALWIDREGYLWIPCAQQNRTPAFQQGVSRVEFPVIVYKMKLGAKPVRR